MPPEPPRVDCKQGWAAAPGKVPRTFDQPAWVAWARKTLGLWEEDRKLRRIEHECVQGLKDKGVIK